MLYLFYGTDHDKLRATLERFRTALRTKRPDAELFKLDDPDQLTAGVIEELATSRGLFEHKYIVQLDRILESAEAKELVSQYAASLAASENVFLVVEGELDAPTRKKLEKHAADVFAFPVTAKKQEEYNAFRLADALGKRDKKTLWTEYQRAKMARKEPEELHGILHWQLKTIMLAMDHSSAEAAGLKPFPYKKASGFANNFSRDELADLSRRLVATYHEARRGNGELGDNLERFILAL